MMPIARNAKSTTKFLKVEKLMYRDDCKYFRDRGDLYFCKEGAKKICYEAQLTLCQKYEIVSNPKYKKQEFIREEEFSA